jgi:hypothetical protein
VEAVLKLAKGLVNQLNTVSLGRRIWSERASRRPGEAAAIGDASRNVVDNDAVAWAAGEQDEIDGSSCAGTLPSNLKGLANGWVSVRRWSKNRIVCKLCLKFTLAF